MANMYDDIMIEPHRLEWDQEDNRSVSQGGSLLGEGTFGSVYRGELEGISVAIKVMKAPSGNLTTQRAVVGRKAAHDQHVREIRRLTKLRFKHVVPCYGVSRAANSDDLYIITECLDGGSLHGSLEKVRAAGAALTDVSLLRVCSHIAKGLLYIHNSKYIHGDMKPHNVLLNVGVVIEGRYAYFPDHVEAKVADFGMSKRLKSDDSLSLAMSTAEFGNHPFGTYAYMAPESFNGVRDLDDDALKAVDVFAFGVLFYEMLTGMSPWKFEGVQSPMQLQQLVVFKRERPTWGTRDIDPEMRRLVERCWHHDAYARPETIELCKTFGRLLKEAIANDPMSTRASSESSGSVGAASFSTRGSTGTGGRIRARQYLVPDLPPSPSTPSTVDVERIGRPRSEDSDLYHSIESPAAAAGEPASTEDGRRLTSSDSESDGPAVKDADHSSRRTGGMIDRPVVENTTGLSTGERRNYWENRNAESVKNTIAVKAAGNGRDIGESTANAVGGASTASSSVSSSVTSSTGLAHTMGGIEIRRVETQIINQPEQPQLAIPGFGLPMAGGGTGKAAGDIFNGIPSAQPGKSGNAANLLWDNSLVNAVNATNEASRGRGRPAAVPVVESAANETAGVGLSLELPTHQRSVSSPVVESNVAAMAGMTLELPEGGPGHRRGSSIPGSGVNIDAEISLLGKQDIGNPCGGGSIYGKGPSKGNGNLNSSVLPPHVSGYPGGPQRSGQNSMTASTRPDLQTQPQLTSTTIMQALQGPNGASQIIAWWESSSGNCLAIAAALAREEFRSNSGNQQQIGSERVKLIVGLLKKVNRAQVAGKSATNANVARELCIALGNVSRGGTVIDREAAELALPMTLSTLQVFTWDMSVYSTACYALANMLKVSNEISQDRVRRDVADWISHATSFNLNNQTGPQPTLAYTTAAAARNYTWRKPANAAAFLARREGRREGNSVVHPSAAENLCKSMVFFIPDPTVVEVCLSAFAALAFFPQHRISLLKIGTVRAVARVMDRPVTTQNSPLLAMGLATLGTIASRSAASTTECNHIVDALTNEGGLQTVVKALSSAVRARNARLMEEGLCALAAFARFDQRLGRTVVQNGGVSPVINAVFCSVNGAPNDITKRSAEVMCDVADVLSQHAAAVSMMRQTGLSAPLKTLVGRYSNEPRVTKPGHQAIARIQ